VANTVYGTILAMASLTAAYATEKHPVRLALIVISGSLVIWLAHLHAHLLASSLAARRHVSLEDVRHACTDQLGILLSAAVPSSALLLGAIGLVREPTAVLLAFGLGLATLAVAGFRYARIERLGPGGTFAAVAANLALGLLLVLLKVTIAH